MKKIKVLQVIGTLHIGGAETVAMNLYRYIDRNKFEFHYLVYTDDEGEYEKEVVRLGGKVIRLSRDGINKLSFNKKLLSIMKENNYDIVHSHLLFHNSIIMKTAYKAGVKNRISHSHSTRNKIVNHVVQAALQKNYQVIARKQILKYANYFVACSKEAGVSLYGAEKFQKCGMVINNGVDTALYDYNPQIRKKIRTLYNLNGKCVYGNAAHFIPLKNHSFLLEVFQHIKDIQKNAYLILMGDGELKKNIEDKVRQMGLTDSVLFTGNISNVNEMLQALDIFVLPSLYEGLSISLIESQVAGLRCIASDTVPSEVDICKLIQFISLDEEASVWAEKCVKYSEYQRKSSLQLIKDRGYDIAEVVHKVEAWYRSMLEDI